MYLYNYAFIETIIDDYYTQYLHSYKHNAHTSS